MPALAPADVVDIERLRRMSNRELQALGRIPYPFVYRRGDRGFTRISWDEALRIAGGPAAGGPWHVVMPARTAVWPRSTRKCVKPCMG